MAECEFCGQDMLTADGCTKTHIIDPMTDGKDWIFPAIPFGYEKDWPDADRCHDCNAKTDEHHHVGCDVERHPRNGEQLLMQVISADEYAAPRHARIMRDPHADISRDDLTGDPDA